jgi:hypothetical protein
MGVTKTVHPPAGATALLCSTTPAIEELGWFLIPLVLIGSVLLVAVGCILNNIQRTFPVFWWTPVDLRAHAISSDIERAATKGEKENEQENREGRGRIEIDGERILVPDWLELEYEEKAILEILRHRLGEGRDLVGARSKDSAQTADSEATRVHAEVDGRR